MSKNVIQLDNNDEMLIYQQNLNQKQRHAQSRFKSQNSPVSSKYSKEQSFLKGQNKRGQSNKGVIDLVQLPSKFILRPLLLKYIDKIQQLFLEEKSPNQIQAILKEPTLVEIQCILKEKIHTFLNIIFESSHCFTEEQVQKIRPQVNEKIERISLQMLEPFKNNFLDSSRYENFLKLMKYHKEGRRSQKISKKCNTFFRLFFLKMKFQGINHTEGNVVQLNELSKKKKKTFLDSNDSYSESDVESSKQKKNNKSSRNDDLYGSKTSNKKNCYGRQTVVNQKMMDDAKQALFKQIKSKAIQTQSQKHNQHDANLLKMNESFSQNKPQILSNKSEVQILHDQDTFQWIFDKENTLLFLLFEALFKKSKLTKTIRMINETFSKKYDKISKQPLNFDRIISKIQSMFSISCQKFIRRIKFLTIKQGLSNNPNSTTNENRKQNSSKSSKKKKVYSIMDIEKSIEIQNNQKSLSKEDEFYFSKLKEYLKALQVKQVYLSSAQGSPYQQEWKFMLQFIREFYFSALEDLKFDHLLEYAKRVIQLNTIEKKLDQESIFIEDEDERSQEEEKQKKSVDNENDLLNRLPKSSFCFTLSKIGKTNSDMMSQNNNIKKSQNSQHHQNGKLQFVSIDEILKNSNNQKLWTSITNKPIASVEQKNRQFKRSYSNHLINDSAKQENQEQDLRKIRKLGEPMKKIKQNEKLTQQNLQPEDIYKITQSKLTKDEFESDDQFEEIVELSSSIEDRIIDQHRKKNEVARQVFSYQSDSQQEPEQKTRINKIVVKPRGAKHITADDGQVRNNQIQIQDLINETQKDQESDSQDDQHRAKPTDLSIIQEQDQEDASQIISNKKVTQKTKNLLALEDEYSIYEIDFSTQQHPQAEQQNSKSKPYQTTKQNLTKTNRIPSRNFVQDQQINQITDTCQNLEIIRQELQEIKSTNDSQPMLQPKSYSEKILNSDNDRFKLHAKTNQNYK